MASGPAAVATFFVSACNPGVKSPRMGSAPFPAALNSASRAAIRAGLAPAEGRYWLLDHAAQVLG